MNAYKSEQDSNAQREFFLKRRTIIRDSYKYIDHSHSIVAGGFEDIS